VGTSLSESVLGYHLASCTAPMRSNSWRAVLSALWSFSNSAKASVAWTVNLCPMRLCSLGTKPGTKYCYSMVVPKEVLPSYPGMIGCLYIVSLVTHLALTKSMSL
jgi:hypothetical protein